MKRYVNFSDIQTALAPKAPPKGRLYLDSVVVQNNIIFYSNAISGVILKNRVSPVEFDSDYKIVIPRSAVKELIALHKQNDIKIASDSVLEITEAYISMNGIRISVANVKYPFTNVYEQFNQYNNKKAIKASTSLIDPRLLDVVSKVIKLNPDIEKLNINLFEHNISSSPVQFKLGSDIEIYVMQLLG